MDDSKAQSQPQQQQTHPLEDVSLNENDDDKQTPKNWVKFDDEGDGGEKNNNSNGSDATQQQEQQQQPPQPQQRQNKLALPPPPSVVSSNNNRRARSRSPNEQSTTPTTTTPVQRSAVSSTTAAAPVPVPVPVPASATASLPDVAPAVLTTESTHVNLSASGSGIVSGNVASGASGSSPARHPQKLINQKATVASASSIPAPASSSSHHNGNGSHGSTSIPMDQGSGMRTIELSTGRIREGFANGDVIVTLLPANTKWPWITPAIFRPELVPEELMAQGLTLTVEDYVNAMETLVNDYRFTVYNICYKRILVCWILFAFTVLLALLFSGLQGVALFALGVGWLFLNAAAIFLCMWVKLRLSRGLEKCLARVNKQLMRHKILLVLDDRGRISCHKVNLCFMYFDATQCVSFLNEFLEHTEQNGGEAIKAGWEAKLDIDLDDIVIQGSQPVRMPRKQERGLQLFLRYASRWGMEALRGLVDVTPLEPGRHCGQFQCPCQYIKEHLQCKPRAGSRLYLC
ncbi:blast:Transmembrane protein C9orf91 homolog [Drosophila guanche]|uniref:Blast:Transmembrane protein C9orf91 homolog n=1 Tax=Drosophila guanche TaxID=7266 RepID=A0A3B0JJ94_DROGU|nr:blast:Transmembrane protein C9orf91 homolog [Drosophila guanche]